MFTEHTESRTRLDTFKPFSPHKKIGTVALVLNATGLKQSYGAVPLFENLSFNVSEGQRLGLIGPNGSGKSTLLEIIAGKREPDGGTVALRKNTRLAYVSQQSEFLPEETVRTVIEDALRETA